jgi:hypothetical protein
VCSSGFDDEMNSDRIFHSHTQHSLMSDEAWPVATHARIHGGFRVMSGLLFLRRPRRPSVGRTSYSAYSQVARVVLGFTIPIS